MSICVDLQEADAKLFEFAKSADDGSLGNGRPPKMCPDVPNEFRVTGCKQRVEAHHSSWTRNTHGLTGNVG